jgi:hypothetical protein
VLHDQLEEEAVELRRGQRVGAREVERVLRRDHEEELVERVAGVVDGDLLLAHGLEHRGLHLGRGAVDLVGQHHVREQRPRAEHEALRLHVEDVGARDVAGQQVRRELDAPEGRDALGEIVVVAMPSPSARASVVLPEPG